MIGKNLKGYLCLIITIIITTLCIGCGGSGSGDTIEPEPEPNSNTAPTTPTELSQNFSQLSVELSWLDNSDNESGFVIERAIDNNSFSQLATVAANATSYTDTTITNQDQEVHYRVIAINQAGESEYSNQVSISVTAINSCSQITSESNCLSAGTYSLQCEWNQSSCEDYISDFDFTPDPVNTGDRLWPEQHGQAIISAWKNDKLAAFSFTIDDNCAPDHEWWVEQGNNYGFRFTWFVITQRIGVENTSFNGFWSDYQALFDLGHDIQSHTYTHNYGEYTAAEEYSLSQEQIEANLVGAEPITLAYPGGLKDTEDEIDDKAVAAEYYISARGVGGHINRLGDTNYMDTYVLGTAVFTADDRVGLPNLIEYNSTYPQSITYRGWQVHLFHSLNDDEKAEALSLMDYLSDHSNDFWVGLYREVVLYGQERDTAKLEVLSTTDDSISLRLRDQKNDDIFDYPLTIKVRINNDWNGFYVRQNGIEVDTIQTEHEGNKYLLIQAIPDAGDIVIDRI